MPHGRVYFSFRSPYARLGLHAVDRAGLNPQLFAFSGPPKGVVFSDPVENPLKLAYYFLDAPRMTARMGLPMKGPDPFEVDLGPANNAFYAADKEGAGRRFALAVADARWGEGRNVSEIAVLRDCAVAAELNPAMIEAAQDDPQIEERKRTAQTHIEEDGVFGVPFAVFGAEKFWGHDRFDLYAEAVKQATS